MEIVAIKNLMQIDAGLGQVVATDTSQTPYYLVGNEWIRLPGSLRHITVGPTGIWGVSNGNLMFKYVAGNWARFATGVKQLDAGGDQFVVVANMDYVTGCLSRSASLGFMGADSSLRGIRLPGALNQDCQNNGWRHIDGKLSMIEVATDGSVFGVNSACQVYTRDGITASKPEGTGWSNVPMCMPMKHVTYDLGRLWVISNSGFTMVCTH